MSHSVFNGSEYPTQWGSHHFPPRTRVELTDREFAVLLSQWQEGGPQGGIVISDWGQWLPDMRQYLEANPLDPMLLDVYGIGPARIMRLYQIGVCSMYDLAVVDPVLVADHLEVAADEAEAMVGHVMKADDPPPVTPDTDPENADS